MKSICVNLSMFFFCWQDSTTQKSPPVSIQGNALIKDSCWDGLQNAVNQARVSFHNCTPITEVYWGSNRTSVALNLHNCTLDLDFFAVLERIFPGDKDMRRVLYGYFRFLFRLQAFGLDKIEYTCQNQQLYCVERHPDNWRHRGMSTCDSECTLSRVNHF